MSQLFQSTFHTLTMDEAKIEIEDNPNIIIVDVRTPEEYQKGHIPGAINVPVETPQLITEKIPDKNETIFVCLFSRSCIIMPTFKEAERQNCGKKSDSFAVLRLVRR